jgi:hypothetical protein
MRPTTPLLKTLAARGLLALAFLFAQHTASLHWLSHAIESTQAKAGAANNLPPHCDECLTLAAFGAAAPSDGPVLPQAAGQHALAAPRAASPPAAALRLAFRSRAPPILI